jgi:hypothetical protein
MYASEAWSDTAQGTYIAFNTTANTTTTLAERMRIDNAGNVGIGTTSPAALLSSNVNGSGSVTALNLTNSNTGLAAGTGPAINFGINNANLGAFGKIEVLNQTATSGSNSYMAFSTRGGDVLAERMRIDSSGNVGIGTASPTNKLTVIGGNGATLRLDNAGERYTQINFNNNSTNKAAITLDNTNSLVEHYCASGIFQTFWSNNTERMRIHSSGGVSIGNTTDPGATNLSVTGAIVSNGAGVLTTAGSYTMTGGARITSFNLGNTSGASITPNAFSSNYQFATNNGAGTINAPAADCAIDILLSNTTGASTITFSGYTVVANNFGDPLTTTTTARFIISIRRINSISTYTIKQIAT